MKNPQAIIDLLQTIEALRSPNGCPWDKAQTHQSLKRYLLEETYETMQAIDELSYEDLAEELGDLLFQIVLHCQIAQEKGKFDFYEIAARLNQKMINRHPHVFGDKAEDLFSQDLSSQWEQIKSQEQKSSDRSAFAGIPPELPSLARLTKVLKKAQRKGLNMIEDKLDLDNEEEIGDALLEIVRHSVELKIDPEDILRRKTLDLQRGFERELGNKK